VDGLTRRGCTRCRCRTRSGSLVRRLREWILRPRSHDGGRGRARSWRSLVRHHRGISCLVERSTERTRSIHRRCAIQCRRVRSLTPGAAGWHRRGGGGPPPGRRRRARRCSWLAADGDSRRDGAAVTGRSTAGCATIGRLVHRGRTRRRVECARRRGGASGLPAAAKAGTVVRGGHGTTQEHTHTQHQTRTGATGWSTVHARAGLLSATWRARAEQLTSGCFTFCCSLK
jgi:hypothetical protein